MDAVELARKLQEKAMCSICLDYFTDPVTTTCGHNFCRECIWLTWEKAKGKKGRRKRKGSFPCPKCGELSSQRNLWPNRLLTKVAEMAWQHPDLQSRDLCKVHQELLKLFCKDDQSPTCVVCRESREHRPLRVVPVEEAMQEHKLKLKEDIGRLREERAKTQKLQTREQLTLAKWQEKVEDWRRRILVEFEKLGVLLEEEQQRLLQALRQEEELTPWRKNSVSVQYPETTPTRLRMVCRLPRKIVVLKTFRGRFAEDVVPDPATAYPYLLLYESRQRHYLSTPPDGTPCSKDRFLAYPCAVGHQTFSSKRHYWEVGMNLTGDALWALGECRDVSRKDRVLKSPKNGFWVVQLLSSPPPSH